MTSRDTASADASAAPLETLSALFDGELQGEARLFAMRRLSHDESWKQACGNWQLIGDTLRRSSSIAAPPAFAANVAAAIAAEPTSRPAGSVIAPRRAGMTRWRWAGGALAASVALLAVLVGRPFAVNEHVPESLPVVATVPGGPSMQVPPPVVPAGPMVAVESSTEPAMPSAHLRAPVSRRIAGIASRRAAPPAETPPAAPATDTAALLVASAANPFALPSSETLAPRPWPRAALGRRAAGNAFVASYGHDAAAVAPPSFYPFGPGPRSADTASDADPSPAP